eukprot:CAMPEP_0198108108 /NCGR_PEP_ID=MMETSP1442-20131203/200_1 /TAXON_ID= /ORGANISM="Craspedostauros australis, Strain CCMP3328" /LENGTH=107 /DNA_ID=CAMNT_0043763311 /DNA_START=76 /DNA_END=399 /DNA_ORIENTATION=-
MNRLIVLIATVAAANAFAPQPNVALQTRLMSEPEEDNRPLAEGFQERGVSVDQDGKSNVWAIEPKMEISTKSSEENMSSALIAGGGLAAFAVVAGIVLTNLPDPNQF